VGQSWLEGEASGPETSGGNFCSVEEHICSVCWRAVDLG